MKRLLKADTVLFYFILSLIYMDFVFRMFTAKYFMYHDLVVSFLFLIALALIFFLIATFFHGRLNRLLSTVLLTITAIIYSSQFIYFRIFKTYYSVYSAGNGAQVLEFWRDIIAVVHKNILIIALIFLPVFIMIFFGKRFLYFEKIDWLNRLSIVICIALAHGAGIGAVYAGGKGQHSAYDFYYKESYPVLSVERLGLLTTMRLDLQRQISGWSPPFELTAPDKIKPPGSSRPAANQNGEEEPEEIIEYNVMDIDFDELIAGESNATIKDMHNYFKNVKPTKKNEFTGKYKGYNLIFITAEAFSPFAVKKEVTPTLYKMVHEGYHFTNFYTPLWGVSTSDGEYVACTGLVPKNGIWSFRESGKNYLPFVMGNQLRSLGYKTMAYHNHTYTYYGRNLSHPNMGYEYKGLGNGLNVKKTWPASDLEMMQKTVHEYIGNEPFHAYYMTVSGHLQYNFYGNHIAAKNRSLVEHLPYSEQAKAYLATQIELDRALEYLLNELEKAGVAERTLIALSSDHYPYGLEKKTIDEFAGHPVETNFELYRNTFILYTKGMEPMTIAKPASSLDIIPTLSNLLGLEYDSRLLMGQDIFSDSAPLIMFANKSFITDKGRYNSETGKFTPNPGVNVDQAYIDYISSVVEAKFYYSAKILETDYYRNLF